jgi:uncharacterized protein involved in outer membrane biogenesis
MKKAIKWTLIIVPLVLIIGIIILLLCLDSIVRSTVEKQTTASTNLPAKLTTANVGLFSGEVKLDGFSIGSPQGFSPEMFDLGGLHVKVSYSEMMGQPIRIAEITVDSPKLTIEQQGGKFNVQAAMAGMPKSESSSTMRLIIGRLEVKNTQVVVRPNLPFLQKEYTTTLPSVVVQNIGTDEGAQNGAAIKDVLQKVMDAMMDKLQQSGKLPPELAGAMKGGDLKAGLQEQANQRVQAATQQAQQKAQQELQKGLDSLLKKKK